MKGGGRAQTDMGQNTVFTPDTTRLEEEVLKLQPSSLANSVDLEHRFELHLSNYRWIFFNIYMEKFVEMYNNLKTCFLF